MSHANDPVVADNKTDVIPLLFSTPSGDGALVADGSSLPLGMLVSYAKVYKEGLLNQHYNFFPLINRPHENCDFYLDRARTGAPAIWLLSCYVWNFRESLALAKEIKALSPDSLILAGGPHIPAYEEENRQFLVEHPFIDLTSRGEGEITLSEILETLIPQRNSSLKGDFSPINGVAFLQDGKAIRTKERVKSRDIDKFPSPYITGELNDPSFNDLPIIILETNRGCPFGCTFCDWGAATLQKFSLFDLDRVLQEIDIIAQKRPFSVYLGDSNFGAFERDIQIAEAMVAAKKKYGYPKKFGCSFAKNASPRLARIIKILSSANMLDNGLISMQSADADTLSAINRANIKNEKYELLIDIFKKEGMNLSSELLIGLPGQTVNSHKNDLQFFIDRKLMTIAYCTAVMPNAPMNAPEYREKYQIKTNKDGYVTSTSTFDEKDLQKMLLIFMAFQFFYGLSVLKYFLYFIQMEHAIKFMDVVVRLLDTSEANPQRYPLNYQLQHKLLVMKRDWAPSLEWTSEEAEFLFNNIDAYYDEVLDFVKTELKLELPDSVTRTLVECQKAVLPRMGKTLPVNITLEHDLVAYIQQVKDIRVVDHCPVTFKPLSSFPPGKLEVSTLKNKPINNVALSHLNRFTGAGWELRSPLRFF
ncbi:MAG: radical SAM protein [Pseudomonadales bacterium]|nr:radical SAM protein [Pseudomonadales bacterium]